MIDIGVNIQHDFFLDDLDDTISQALEAGVERMVCIASDLEESAFLQTLGQSHSALYVTSGCHPHNAKSWNANSKQKLQNLIAQGSPVAIGETGLDFNRNYSSQDEQRYAFSEQIELALEYNLPLYLHERDAHKELISILKTIAGNDIRGVIHCFTGSIEELHEYLALGLYIGVTGWVCDERRGHELQQAVPYIPADKLLLETDAPYLIPRNIRPRPKKNHPKYLPWVAEEVARLRGVTLEELVSQTRHNTKQCFGLE